MSLKSLLVGLLASLGVSSAAYASQFHYSETIATMTATAPVTNVALAEPTDALDKANKAKSMDERRKNSRPTPQMNLAGSHHPYRSAKVLILGGPEATPM